MDSNHRHAALETAVLPDWTKEPLIEFVSLRHVYRRFIQDLPAA